MPKKLSTPTSSRIQVTYKGVGRIRVRVRGVDSAGLRRIHAALDEFYAANNLLALRAVKEGIMSPPQALELLRTSGANATVRAGMFEPLRTTLFAWLETHDVAPATRKSYRDHLKQLAKDINQTHSVSDLPAVLRTCRARYVKRGAFRTFNVIRSMCCAFADNKFGDHSSLYVEVFSVKPMSRPKSKPKRDTVGLEVADIVLLTSLMRPHHAEHVWSMCLTGMRRNEFFGIQCPAWKWADNIRAIKIDGRKTANSDRTIFRMDEVTKPTLGPLAIERAIRKARAHPLAQGLPPIHLHAFRYTCRHWCDQAGINKNHIENYLGWSDDSMFSHYGKINVLQYVDEDRLLLAAYIQQEKQKLAAAQGAPEQIRELRNQHSPAPVFYNLNPSR